MNKVITVKQLWQDLSKLILSGHGDKHIVMCSDDEMNDITYMRDGVVTCNPNELKELDYNERIKRDKFDYKDFILLG